MQVSALLCILPPPSDWQGKSLLSSGLGGYPAFKKIEQAGKGYEDFLLRKLNGNSGESLGNLPEKEILSPQKSSRKVKAEHLKHERLVNGTLDCFYDILGLDTRRWEATEEEIRNSYRRMVVRYHPDKNPDITDEAFKKIQEAFDTLTDPQKRRAYDSQDDKEIVNPPSKFDADKDNFYKVFGKLFGKLVKWSIKPDAPALGNDETPLATVEAFYKWWYGFKSWKDFSYLDEHKSKQSDSRDEKRWQEKENEKGRKKEKKAETSRIRAVVEAAEKFDPRIRKAKDAKKNADQKIADEKARIIREQREAEEKKAAEEKQKREEEEKLKSSSEAEKKKQKAAENKKASKFRNKIRGSIAKNSLLKVSVDSQELVLSKLNIDQLEDLNNSSGDNQEEARDAFESYLALVKSETAGNRYGAGKVSISVSDAKPWNEEELTGLKNSLTQIGAETADRWEKIAASLPSRSVTEVVMKFREFRKESSPSTR